MANEIVRYTIVGCSNQQCSATSAMCPDQCGGERWMEKSESEWKSEPGETQSKGQKTEESILKFIEHIRTAEPLVNQ